MCNPVDVFVVTDSGEVVVRWDWRVTLTFCLPRPGGLVVVVVVVEVPRYQL